MSTSPLVLWLDDEAALQPGLTGGKGSNLARLTLAGFRVPRGFCVTTEAYALARRFGEPSPGTKGTGQASDRRVTGRLASSATGVPLSVAEQIQRAYRALGVDGDDVAVAVRSSATAEDQPEASFAGQQDTYLNVRGARAVVEAVGRCWASLRTERAASYRAERGLEGDDVLAAVVVQEMLQPEVAGVLFTADPVHGRLDEMVVNASYGLGEAVVGGLVTPDTFVVGSRDGSVRHSRLGDKRVELVCGPESTVDERAVDPARSARLSLSREQVRMLAELGRTVQGVFGAPQDIEWALCHGELYLLQSRPITTLSEPLEVDPRDHWTRALFTEIIPDAPSPAFCSVLEPLLAHMLHYTFGRLRLRDPADAPPVGIFYHQPYLNLRYIHGALSGLPPATAERLAARLANPFSAHVDQRGPGRTGISVAELRLALRVLLLARTLPGEVDEAVRTYYGRLEAYAARDPRALSLAKAVRDVKEIALGVLPPLLAHDFLLIAVLGFVQRLVDACVERAGVPDAARVRGELMSGVTGNVTMRANEGLWCLAEEARRHPAVAAVIQADAGGVGSDGNAIASAEAAATAGAVASAGAAVTTGATAGAAATDDLLARLADVEGGARFAAALERFLDEFGHREVRMDIAFPTWGEDPTAVLGFVRSYLAAAGAESPAQRERSLASARARSAAEVDEALGRRFLGRLLFRPLFRWLLRRSEELARERDTMHFHWTASFPVLRRYLLAIGGDLVEAGRLERASDIFCLTLEGLDRCSGGKGGMQREAEAGRLAWERDRRRRWPTEIRRGEEYYDDEPQVAAAGDQSLLQGTAGSPGLASGPVCIVRGTEEFGKMQPGHVLVAPLTNPAWTPLFAVAEALVAETGGTLSHGAIVAREFGIPAVLGVRGATSALRDGQVVAVDGSAGTVEIAGE